MSTTSLQPMNAFNPLTEVHAPVMVSLIVPIYNEADSVPQLLIELARAGEQLNLPYEIILVNDGSSDRTLQVLTAEKENHPDIPLRIVDLRRNYGQTAAMAAGFATANGQIFVTLDGDLQNNPADIPHLVSTLIQQNVEMVVGWRQQRQDTVITRKIPSYIANRLIGALTGVKFRDYGCSLKAYRRELAQEMPLYGELHRFIPVLASMEGATIAQVPVSHRARQFGHSKYNLSRTVKVILDLGMLLFLKRFFSRPLHLFGRVGLVSMLSGLGILGYLTAIKLFQNAEIGHRPLLLLGALLLMSGIQLISTGLLAELQIRTYFEAQQKPAYKIRQIL